MPNAEYIDCRNTVADANGDVDIDRLLLEMRVRDPRWLNKGIVPLPLFESAELEADIRKNRPHELRTAMRLNRHGMFDAALVAAIERCRRFGGRIYVLMSDGGYRRIK